MREHRLLVDRLIDEGLALSPATDWSLTLPQEWVSELPLDGEKLHRPVDTRRAGYFRAPVYRNLELVPQPLAVPVLILSDQSGLQPTLYLNVGTGIIGRTPAEVGLDPSPPA